MLHFALRRSARTCTGRRWTSSREHHAALKNQKPAVLWFTGLSGAGKSTIANLAVEKKLARMNRHTALLDGDNIRHGLNKDLGFAEADRVENIRRVGEVAKLMADAGLIVITAFISPFRAERDMVRAMLAEGEFVEIHIDTPLAEAERRDVKGLYAKARAGQLKNFTGVDSPYEPPEHPELRIDTTGMTPDEAAQVIVEQADRVSAGRLDDAELAEVIATTAGELLLSVQRSGLFEGKAMGKVGDEVANDFILRALAQHRPKDAVLSEGGDQRHRPLRSRPRVDRRSPGRHARIRRGANRLGRARRARRRGAGERLVRSRCRGSA